MMRERAAIRRATTEARRSRVMADDQSNVMNADASTQTGRPSAAEHGPGMGFNLGDIAILPPEWTVGRAGGDLSPALSMRIRSAQGGGEPLAPETRAPLEGAFGHTFADVRLHADGEADALSARLGAAAFTTGADVFFRQGAYQSSQAESRRLLAHELTHVMQQRGGPTTGPLSVRPSGDAYEHAAHAAGGEAAGALATPTAPPASIFTGGTLGGANAVVQREDDDAPSGDQPAPPQDDDAIEELVDDFVPEEGDETDQDLIAILVPDLTPDPNPSGGPPDQAAAAPPVARFIDGGRDGTARYGDAPGTEGGVFPHAFTDAGQTATTKWAGGGGAGAHGNQSVGSVQKHVAPVFFQVSKKADAFIKENTGQLDVLRSWTGVNAGDQGNGHFLTAAAAARINQHETRHVANTSTHYSADIDPLLLRVANRTMDVVIAKALLPSATQRTLAALKTEINWGPSVKHFQAGDKADNTPMGPVDVADLASGTYPIDVGPGTVAGKAFQHRVRIPTEANPAP
jgi:hypothetical protein